MIKKISLLLIITFSCGILAAQDGQISLFTSSHMYQSPAFIGVYKNSKTQLRGQLNHRNQWSFLEKSITINSFAFDMPIPDTKLSAGIIVMNNSATEGAIKDFSLLLGAAYKTILSEQGKKSLSLGIQFGYRQKSFSPDDLNFGDEFVQGTTSGFLGNTSEKFSNTSVGYVDFSFGALWFVADKWRKFRPWVGISAYHLAEPTEEFVDISNITSKNFRKYLGTMGAYVDITSAISLTPKILFKMQNNIIQYDMGVIGYLSNQKKQASIVGFGGYFRAPSESIIPMVSFEWDNITLMLDYEVNISTLKSASNGSGAFEIGVRYALKNKRVHNVKLM